MDPTPPKQHGTGNTHGKTLTHETKEDAKIFKEIFGIPTTVEEKTDIIQAQIINILRREAAAGIKENEQDKQLQEIKNEQQGLKFRVDMVEKLKY